MHQDAPVIARGRSSVLRADASSVLARIAITVQKRRVHNDVPSECPSMSSAITVADSGRPF